MSLIIGSNNLILRYRKILRALHHTQKIILRKELLNRFKKKSLNWIIMNVHMKSKEKKKSVTMHCPCKIKIFRAVKNYVKKREKTFNMLC
jgi:hypothetical protein